MTFLNFFFSQQNRLFTCYSYLEIAIYIGIVRDDRGLVIGALSGRIFGKFSPHLGERLELREGVVFARACGLMNWVLESDALNAVNTVRAPDANIVVDRHDITHALGSGLACHISRNGN